MKAAVARLLKVGDTVGATFGNYRHKDCIILSIDWPVFTLQWKDYRGRWQCAFRSRYDSTVTIRTRLIRSYKPWKIKNNQLSIFSSVY